MNSSAASYSLEGISQSTSQKFIDTYLARRKREEVDRFMDVFMEWLDSPAVTYASGGRNVPCPTTSGQSGSPSNDLSQNSTDLKRCRSPDSFDSSSKSKGSETRSDKRKSKKSKSNGTDKSSRMNLACPFFIHDPEKYRRSACTGPGWPSISRLKEHIYRAHKQPEFKCNRCCQKFENGEQLTEHQRAEDSCKISKDISIDGINDSQYLQLRKRSIGKKSNVVVWSDMYRIIFPKAKSVPSCYYDYDQTDDMPKYRDEDIALTEYIENEVIAGVRNDLEDQFEKFAEDTRASLMDIVKRRFKRTYQKFHDQGRALISRKSSRSAQSTQQTVAQTLEATFPDVNFDSLAEFDVDYPDSNLQFDFINGLDFPSQISDSAYGSMGSPFRA